MSSKGQTKSSASWSKRSYTRKGPRSVSYKGPRSSSYRDPQKLGGWKRKRSTGPQKQSQDEPFSEPDSTRLRKKKKVAWEGGVAIDEQDNDSGADNEVNQDLVCLAITCQGGRLGCAFYDSSDAMIHLLDDVEEDSHYDLTRMLLEQIHPNFVLTSSRSDEKFMDVIRDHMCGNGTFQVRPHREFVAQKGRDRLLSLKLLAELPLDDDDTRVTDGFPTEPKNAYEFMRQRNEAPGGDPTLRKWNATLRLSNFASTETAYLCVASAGALLDQLVRVKASSELDDLGVGGLIIRGIQSLSLDRVMQINADALSSLQIFEDQNHASVHSQAKKEGLSLFGILNNTRTILGRSLLRQWFLRPSLSIPTIVARHNALSCFTRTENIGTADAMQSHLRGIKGAPRMLKMIRTGKGILAAWQFLVKFAYHTMMLRECVTELCEATGVEVLRKLERVLDVAIFNEMGEAVNETIEWDESVNEQRVCVKPLIDPKLDEWKHMYHGLDDLLFQVAKQISAATPPEHAASVNVVYFPQLGFLICIPLQHEWQSAADFGIVEGWTFQFASQQCAYFKSEKMQDMDRHIGDLHHLIVDREIEIMQELLERVLVHNDLMMEACDVCAELDCLLSLAQASREYEYVRPSMTNENIIDIKQGRHPLQERVVDVFVPNDSLLVGGAGVGCSTSIGDSSNRDLEAFDKPTSVIICTGANACGKVSVYLKQIALVSFMAQIGCFVPAAHATLGLVDKIFTRVHTKESVSKMQSAFMTDLHQVSLALRNATARSLCIFDEFGKGTKASDGAGLFCGLISSLLNRGAQCPKVLAATHFHEIMQPGMLSSDLPISFVHMEVMLSSNEGGLLETSGNLNIPRHDAKEFGRTESITYLFRVARGLCANSHASQCALMWGIPNQVVQRAEYVSALISNDVITKLLDERMTVQEQVDLKAAEDICRRFLMLDLMSDREEPRKRLKGVLGRGGDHF